MGGSDPWAWWFTASLLYRCLRRWEDPETGGGYDDALDAFGLHCIGGITGGILTGVFCVPGLSWTDYGGLLYTGDPSLLLSQVAGILVTIVFVGVADVILGLIVRKLAGGLRVAPEIEARGLDVTVHGETAYPAYLGLD